MNLKKNWFHYFSLLLFLFGVLYIMVSGISAMGEGNEYPWFVQGRALILLGVLFVATHGIAVLHARLQPSQKLFGSPLFSTVLEWMIACTILVLSLLLRLYYVRMMPMTPESDYKTYYEIAQLLNRGTLLEEGAGYCDYVAIFPHVLGYSWVLAFVLRTFGTSVAVGQYFNVVLAVGTCFFIWRIARMLCGRLSALVALTVSAFWPSQILYNNFLAAEYLFSFLLYFCAWLFLYLVLPTVHEQGSANGRLVLHIVLGVALAATSAIRPMALILLISMVICLASARMPLAVRPRNDLPLAERALEKGWLRALILVVTYLLVSAFFTKCVSYTVNRELAGGSASMGYNLLVGLNEESYGGWNEDDSNYLYEVLEDTDSAEQAQIACRDLALQRLKTSPQALLNLFFHKYDVLWSNDDYGATWNLIFLEQHGELTQARSDFLYRVQSWNDLWYLACVFFAGVEGVYLFKKRGNWAYLFVYLFLGTVAMHLLVENQNRYHFHVLYLFAILAAAGLHDLYEDSKYRVVRAQSEQRERMAWKKEETAALQRIEEAEQYASQRREESMSGYFDMGQALKEGHIVMSVSESCSKEDEQERGDTNAETTDEPT